MKIEQSINDPNQWQVADDAGTLILGYIDLEPNGYLAFGRKLHRGKGGMRERLGPFKTLDEAVKAIEQSHEPK